MGLRITAGSSALKREVESFLNTINSVGEAISKLKCFHPIIVSWCFKSAFIP